MTTEQQLKVQAFLDGELPERETHDVATWIQRDPAATALLAELKDTREAIAAAEPMPGVPETREFYWSKIAREIDRLQPVEATPANRPFRWQQLLWPVGAMTLCFLVVLLQNPVADQAPNTASLHPDADTTLVEAMQPDSNATTYRDESDGTTLVWFSMNTTPESTKTPMATF